ncbi:MAG: dihydrolipoyl dehydrogenase [Deltaproteobacteria bacterium]|nr:MAG: dihydrolipoyl dehydrogenase [Deltaproteobacteria bacterium]
MEVRVPDIGDFKDVPIIAVLVKAGDRIEQEQPIVTLESDKATVDVPAPAAGTVADVRVKVGDKVSEGSVLLILETAGKAAEPQKPKPAAPEQGPNAAPPEEPARRAPREESQAAAARTEGGPFDCDVLVLGSGPGGYAAAFRAADLGKRVVLIERYKALGGVCLNVGCIPSKALLHVASLMDGARDLAGHGVSFGDARIEVEKLRAWKDKVVGRLSGGVAMMAKARKVEVVTGEPQRMLVIGGGIIGMEMATVYSTLGSRIDVVEMLEGLMTGADRDLVQVWQRKNAPRFDRLMLKTKTVGAEAARDGIHVRFDGGAEPAIYDMVLVSVGRTPNGKKIGAETAGVQVDDRGYIRTDKQMRTNVPHIFAIGDIAGPPMLAHKATHEGHVAAEVAAGHKASFDARQVPSVAYTDPEIAWAGATEDELKKSGTEYGKSVFPWSASGRAIANARDEGFVKLLFDKANGRVIGGGIVGLNAGDLISEICLAIEMGADAEDIGRTIHPHPTLGESIGLAAEVFTGTCTDLPPPRRR